MFVKYAALRFFPLLRAELRQSTQLVFEYHIGLCPVTTTRDQLRDGKTWRTSNGRVVYETPAHILIYNTAALYQPSTRALVDAIERRQVDASGNVRAYLAPAEFHNIFIKRHLAVAAIHDSADDCRTPLRSNISILYRILIFYSTKSNACM